MRTALALAAVLLPLAAAADTLPPINVLGGDGVAIGGTDPVAYFVDGGARTGSPDITAAWGGATWRFATEANRDRFRADPARYAPQYGGYCAYGVSRGYAVKINPAAWTIRDGKLYLNYDLAVQDTWREDPAGYVEKADANWPAALAATPAK